MGQKINPTGFRLSVLKNWSSKWYANTKNFPGMLNEDIKVREYLKNGTAAEKSVAKKYDELWKGIEWDWYTNNRNGLLWHWSPEYEFEKNFLIEGYNECLITYVMAASSPDHAEELS